MEEPHVLTFTPVDHPDDRVRRLGFDLSGPYFEQCWGPVLGPSATLLLRRMPILWSEQLPAVISREEIGRSLGIGPGKGNNSTLSHTLDRVVRFGFARWHGSEPSLDVSADAPVLEPHQVERLPEISRRAHGELRGAAAQELADAHEIAPKLAAITAAACPPRRPVTRTAGAPGRGDTGPRPMSLWRRQRAPGRALAKHDLASAEDQIRRAHVCRFPFGKPAGGRVWAVS